MEYQGRGPWTVETAGDGSYHDIEAPCGENDTYTVARVFGVQLDNARLVAVAPDMLLAAEDLIAAIEKDDADISADAGGPFHVLWDCVKKARGTYVEPPRAPADDPQPAAEER